MAAGATFGSTAGIIGIIAGAIIGGLVGYFGTAKGPQAEGLKIQWGPGGTILGSHATANLPQEQAMAEEVTQRYHDVTKSFRELLEQMKAPLGALPQVSGEYYKQVMDPNAALSAFLKGELPRAIASAYVTPITKAMEGLGVSTGRASAEFVKLFGGGDFDKALSALKDYIMAVIRLQDLHKDLTKSLDELETELTATIRDAWKSAADKSLEEIARLSKGLDSLTSEEQVARATEIADLAENQYKANLQYLQQLYQAQQQISDSFRETFLGFEEQKAKGGGAESLGAFYQRQLASLADQMKGATSPEMLQQITQQMLKYGQALWQLNLPGQGANTPWGEEAPGSQAWVEQFLKDQQAAADALLKGWQEEVKAQNDALLAALGAITDALTGELVLREGIKNSLGDEAVIRQRLKGVLDQETDAHNALTNAALAAADALAALGGGGVEPGARRAA
jgi:hypothetical protein